MGGRREVSIIKLILSWYYISQTYEQERFEARKVVLSWECLNIFATGCRTCSTDKKQIILVFYTSGLEKNTSLSF